MTGSGVKLTYDDFVRFPDDGYAAFEALAHLSVHTHSVPIRIDDPKSLYQPLAIP